MFAERVRIDRSACVATLTLDRPESRNALDAATVEQLSSLLRNLGGDPRVRVIELAGAGSCFSAGADLRVMRRMGTAAPAENLADTRRFAELLHLLYSMPKPTLARVQGPVVAGGVGLVACCDIAVAAEDAFFRLSEVQLGLVPAMVGPYVVEALGSRVARRLMLTAERFDARQALQWGLVHEVVPSSDLIEATQGMIRRLLRGAPGAQAVCKELVRDFSGGPLDAAMRDRTARTLATRRSSKEARQGVRSFFKKTRPPWARDSDGQKGCVR